MSAPAVKKRDPRNGLRTSATLATIFTILGHSFLGFEQAVAHVFVALATGYTCAFLFEWVDSRSLGRKPGWAGGGALKVVDWLLSAHMTSITMAFLLYTANSFLVLSFAVAVAIGSKYVLRVRTPTGYRHFMNPSNFGIAVVLLAFQWTGTLPWGITVHTHGWGDWAVSLIVVTLGFRLNLLFTTRLPLIAAWLGTFILQGAARSAIYDLPFLPQVSVLSGIVMVLFAFYMITDPMTSPAGVRSQILFGSSIAILYGIGMVLHINYMIFYSVTIVCAARGLYMALESRGLVPSFVPMVLTPAPAAQAAGS